VQLARFSEVCTAMVMLAFQKPRDVDATASLASGSTDAKDGCLRAHHLNMMCSRGNEIPRPEFHGFCDKHGEFHMFEGAEGKRLVMAMKALEEKILAKVEVSLGSMREEMKREHSSLKSEVKEVAEEQRDLYNKVDEISTEAFECRSDLLDRLDEISREALESRIDLVASLEDIEMKIDSSRETTMGIESLDAQLEQDILQQNLTELEFELKTESAPKAVDRIESLEAQLEQVISLQNGADFDVFDEGENYNDYEAEVQAMGNMCDSEADALDTLAATEKPASDAMELSACGLDLCAQSSPKPPSGTRSQDMWNPTTINWASGVPYSNKVSIAGDTFGRKTSPFAQGFNIHRPRPVGRMTSCQSAPLLEPLF